MKPIIIKLSIFVIVACAIVGCIPEKNDVYNHLSKGEVVSFDVFSRVEQIYRTENKVYLLYDLVKYNEASDGYKLHIIECDTNLVVLGAGKAPLAFIDSIYNDTLRSISTKVETTKSHLFRHDLTDDVNFSKRLVEEWTGGESRVNKVIDSFWLDKQDFLVTFYIRKSDACCHYTDRNQYFNYKVKYDSIYHNKQLLTLPLRIVKFPKNHQDMLSTESHLGSKHFYDCMLLLDENMRNDLLKEIWLSLTKSQNGTP